RAHVGIGTGGLGPRQDDITREGLAAALEVGLVGHPELEDVLRAKFARLDREMPEINLVQADVPEGARYILPERGTAPGLVCETADGRLLYAVAGVPAEMREMMENTILPALVRRGGGPAIVSPVLRVPAVPQSGVPE